MRSPMVVIFMKKGFTLIEILLVVTIIGVLAAMIVPRFAGRAQWARRAAARSDIEVNLAVALDLFELDNGRYPTSEEGLTALLSVPETLVAEASWQGPYIKKKSLPVDPWGNPYQYVCPSKNDERSYDLKSLGSDGVESEDDIPNQ